jgi:hypothetical protein
MPIILQGVAPQNMPITLQGVAPQNMPIILQGVTPQNMPIILQGVAPQNTLTGNEQIKEFDFFMYWYSALLFGSKMQKRNSVCEYQRNSNMTL